MISFDEAIELVRSEARPLGAENVPLSQAAGRVTAAPVIARIDSPRTDVSEMDGYAVSGKDLEQLPVSLEISAQSFPGKGTAGPLGQGTCVRIFTGAPVPDGADRVIIQENVRCNGNHAIFEQRPGSASYIRSRGSDFCLGDQLLETGRVLDPRAIVAAAGADLSSLDVFKRPYLQILSTGDELARPGSAHRRKNAVPDSLSLGVGALAAQWGALPHAAVNLPDDLGELTAAAANALENADVIVVTGGASVGDRDFARTMFEPFGFEQIFSTVAIKPGKPVWFARVKHRLIVGLPGNPTSAMVTARLLLAPLLAALTGRDMNVALNWRRLPLASPIGECQERETFHRASFVRGEVQILSSQQSSAQKALADADCLVRQPANSRSLGEGELVDVLDF